MRLERKELPRDLRSKLMCPLAAVEIAARRHEALILSKNVLNVNVRNVRSVRLQRREDLLEHVPRTHQESRPLRSTTRSGIVSNSPRGVSHQFRHPMITVVHLLEEHEAPTERPSFRRTRTLLNRRALSTKMPLTRLVAGWSTRHRPWQAREDHRTTTTQVVALVRLLAQAEVPSLPTPHSRAVAEDVVPSQATSSLVTSCLKKGCRCSARHLHSLRSLRPTMTPTTTGLSRTLVEEWVEVRDLPLSSLRMLTMALKRVTLRWRMSTARTTRTMASRMILVPRAPPSTAAAAHLSPPNSIVSVVLPPTTTSSTGGTLEEAVPVVETRRQPKITTTRTPLPSNEGTLRAAAVKQRQLVIRVESMLMNPCQAVPPGLLALRSHPARIDLVELPLTPTLLRVASIN